MYAPLKLVLFTFGIITSLLVWGQKNTVLNKLEKQDFRKSIVKNNYMTSPSDSFIYSLLAKNPQYFSSILENKEQYSIQIIYSQVDRKKKKKIKFTDYSYNLNAASYFYPASTVKLPVAILALQKLNELKIAGLDMNTTMITGTATHGQTEVCNDPSAADGRPTIAHYIKKILLVSDNDAFNRLYEFLGQEYINNTLHKMGYKDVQIIHRLEISLNEEQNRQTNPITFLNNDGKIIYYKPAEKSKLKYTERNTKLGKGYIKNKELIMEPFDFSKKNQLTLNDLHLIMRSVIFPESFEKEDRFNLTEADYKFLQKFMSMRPEEAVTPVYNKNEHWPNYVKFLYYGSEKGAADPNIRIFNKVGDAYGYLIDGACFVDFKNNIEFFLSAVIHCNSNEIFNDNTYEYETIGFPFMKNLGKIIYEYELKRERKKLADVSAFHFKYNE